MSPFHYFITSTLSEVTYLKELSHFNVPAYIEKYLQVIVISIIQC